MGPCAVERIFGEVGKSMNTAHVSVLLHEAIDGLDVQRGKRYIDATTGGGGHAVEIARRGGIVLGIDTDPTAVEITREELAKEKAKDWKVIQGNFGDIEELARKEGWSQVHGILFDLGVSSMQLDTPARGFSYRFTDAPLDLRMDQSKGETAAQLVNRVSTETLYDVFSTYGEEQLARPIADAVFRARAVSKIQTVGDMVRIVENVVHDTNAKYAVLSRIFQAMRIAVNEELERLKEGLKGAERLLTPGGRLVVISFHSLEDRIVKQYMRSGGWQVITKHPVLPALLEIETNRRARSAKLRVAMKS